MKKFLQAAALAVITAFATQGAFAAEAIPAKECRVATDGDDAECNVKNLMADYAVMARDAGARIIGGCCGTTTVHLAAMRAALESRPRGPRPTLEQVTAAFGGFSSASDGTDDAPAEGRTRRRRRD